jgi:transcriptional regulator with XRE-family HTH domain
MAARGVHCCAHLCSGSTLPRVAQYHTTNSPEYTSAVAESFGERLRALRTRRRMTPSALAHAVGVTEGAIRQMESGQTKSASLLVGIKLAGVLGVTVTYLATGREKIPETESPSPDRSAPILERLERLERHVLQINAIERRVKALEGRRRAGTRRKAPE